MILPNPPVTRRAFLAAAASTSVWPALLRAQHTGAEPDGRFRHGVASGDPLPDRVMLWTRVTPAAGSAADPIDVQWIVATDERLADIVARGTAQASAEHDFAVKIDAGGLSPARTYHFAFEAAGVRSPVGRTRTAPLDRADRLRLAVVSCANYPAGYFNVYRCLADRDDIDAVVHLGDYIYEFANGVYGDGAPLDRVPLPLREAATLEDYRLRYATYRTDADLQEAHRRHPFIAVWDDHESANNAWSGGSPDHKASQGDWRARFAGAYRAYLEWMPIREAPPGAPHLYRTFRFGGLADLMMLDSRTFRDQQAPAADSTRMADPKRTLLGAAQEAWLLDQIRTSHAAGVGWRLVGQQVMFGAVTPPGFRVQDPDAWDGYPAARGRILDFLASERIRDVAVLTGDIHSSWAIDLPRDPWRGYDPRTGAGSLAVELIAPAISSPPLFSIEGIRDSAPLLRLAAPHIKYLEGDSHGYVLLDITSERLTADWHFVPGVLERSARTTRGASFVCERGSSRLLPA